MSAHPLFSSRVPTDLALNAMTKALRRLCGAGTPVVDLTESNPTRVGIDYPPDLLAPLCSAASLRYEPSPFGLPAARAAVAGDFTRRGLEVDPARIALTASTSEAYSILFKLLCEPGDEVLVPRPSYPLFEHLTRLDAVVARPYPLDHGGHWSLDAAGLDGLVSPRTRAVLVVSPNNPTGSYLKRHELHALASLCAEHGLAVIGDEVFADYPLSADAAPVSVLEQKEALAFGLGGLSKSAGLPQLKLGWVGVGGPGTAVDQALARLEIVCDTYLSVSTPVQQAAGALIAAGARVRAEIRERVQQNRARLVALAARHSSCTVLPAEGGWYSVVQVPATRPEDALVLALLEHDHVLVHPGYFFDFPREAFMVVSLLPPPDDFVHGAACLLARAEA